MHARILYSLAIVLMVFSLFVLWVCEVQRDGEMALARKRREDALGAAFCRSHRGR